MAECALQRGDRGHNVWVCESQFCQKLVFSQGSDYIGKLLQDAQHADELIVCLLTLFWSPPAPEENIWLSALFSMQFLSYSKGIMATE